MPTVSVTSSATALSTKTAGALQLQNTGSVQAIVTASEVGRITLWPGSKTYIVLRGATASARTPSGTTNISVTEITESPLGVDDDGSGDADGRISYADLAPGARSGLAGSSEMTNTYASKVKTLFRNRPPRNTVRRTIGTAPTIGTVVTTSGIASSKFWRATNRSTTSVISHDAFTLLRGGGAIRRGASNPDNNFIVFRGLTTTNNDTMGYTVAFWFDGTTMEFAFRQVAFSYRIVVDGEVAATGSLATVSGSVAYLPVTFATRAMRRVEIQTSSGAGFAGITSGPTDTVTAAGSTGPRCIVLGDSFTAGTGATLGDADGWVGVLRDSMGWPDTWASGAGGTGYLNPGSGAQVTFRSRVQADVIANNPDVVVVAGGINDRGSYTAAAIGAEAALLYAQIKAGLPNVVLVVVAPFWRNGVETFPADLIPARDAIKTAALAAGALWVDLLEVPTQATPNFSQTLVSSTIATATTISLAEWVDIGTTLEIGTGTANVERRVTTNASGGGPFTITVPALGNAHTAGDTVKTVGPALWSGTGKAGATTGAGNSDLLVSSDGTHPTDAGHEAIGMAVVAQLVAQALAGSY